MFSGFVGGTGVEQWSVEAFCNLKRAEFAPPLQCGIPPSRLCTLLDSSCILQQHCCVRLSSVFGEMYPRQ